MMDLQKKSFIRIICCIKLEQSGGSISCGQPSKKQVLDMTENFVTCFTAHINLHVYYEIGLVKGDEAEGVTMLDFGLYNMTVLYSKP